MATECECVRVCLQAFQSMRKGDKQAMAKYNEQQVKQLTRLIEVTRTNLGKVRAVFPAECARHAA